MDNLPGRAGRDMDRLPLYALFALVVHRRSMSAAARDAGLTRSAVSQRIQRLEQVLGMQLLRRTTRRVEPTPAGAALLHSCTRLLESLGTFGSALEREGEEPLRVNGPATFLTAAAPVLAEFARAHPGPLALSAESRHIDLMTARDHVVLRIARAVPESVVARRLFEDELVLVAAPAYLRARGTPARPLDLLEHDCLCYAVSRPEDEWRFVEGRREIVVPVRAAVTADDGGALLALALAGRGLAVVPSFMAAPHVASGALELALPGRRRDRLIVWAIVPDGRRAPRRARAFTDFLARRLPQAIARIG